MSTKGAIPVLVKTQDQELVKGLGLTSATTLVMGSMIGSGIFIVSAEISRLVDSPALLIAAWLITGFMTVTGALAYGELAAMMPRAGGQYVYLRESLGPLWGFLYGWTLFLVIQTGTIAAVGVAFGKFLGYFFPSVSSTNWIWHIAKVPPIPLGPMVLGNMDVGLNTQNLTGIVVVIILTIVNVFGVKTGAAVQNVFTIAKTSALLGLVLLGFAVGRNAIALNANFGDFWRHASLSAKHAVQVGVDGPTALVGTLTILAVVQVGSLFSADAWNNVTFTAGEVKNPKRNLPLSLALGTGTVIFLYIAANFVYLNVLPLDGSPTGQTVLERGIKFAAEDRVGTAVMLQMFGAMGAALMSIAIMISTFGCCNGLIMAGARVYYAMAKDGLFFKSVASLHPKYKSPAISLVVQGVWTCLLCLSGSYGQLLDYIIFAVLVFYILTIAGLFVLRRTRPDAERPYKALGYPVLPAIYIVIALFIDVVLLRYKPQYTWPGLIIVLLGIPVYMLWKRSGAEPEAA
ncbi:MAG: amino acid/polyamine/organocation transporter, superfamily [Candidatus Angelobacter sp.]|jgi:APA family basic amino acid/polyamine antiporter|nr:amino acid/polyamine/organocation transporter, superfamily [Candidatus Angelobacter sp.]